MATDLKQAADRFSWLDGLLVLGLVLLGAWARLDFAGQSGLLERAPERGLLKSDPGLLYYLTSQVAHADGWIPYDWRADGRIAFPDTTDIPADYTVGQEFLFGWSWRLFGAGHTLLRWCHFGAAWIAALAVIGVWGLTRELCGRRFAAVAAALLYLGLPASYRTVGFILVREDLSLMFFAWHLWLVARAARLRTPPSVALAVICAGLALATWHAMSFIIAMEVAAFLLLFLLRGGNAMEVHGPLVVGILLLAYILVPALGGAAFWASVITLALLWVGQRIQPRSPRLAVTALLSLGLALTWAFKSADGASFGHVFEVLVAKLKYGGQLPADSSLLTFDARLLWQGPFATFNLANAPGLLGIALPVGIPACLVALFSRKDLPMGLAIFASACLPVMWLIVRMGCLPSLLLPPLVVFLYLRLQDHFRSRIPRSSDPQAPRSVAELAHKLLPALGLLMLVGQLSYNFKRQPGSLLPWYRPEARIQELAQMVDAVERLVPEGQAVAGDFMSSTAILAHTGRPIVLQPKWERDPARRRIQAFWDAFYASSPADFKEHLVGTYGCEYLLVDRLTLWTKSVSRYTAGLPVATPTPPANSAAASLLGLTSSETPGYRLLWQSEDPQGLDAPAAFQLFLLE